MTAPDPQKHTSRMLVEDKTPAKINKASEVLYGSKKFAMIMAQHQSALIRMGHGHEHKVGKMLAGREFLAQINSPRSLRPWDIVAQMPNGEWCYMTGKRLRDVFYSANQDCKNETDIAMFRRQDNRIEIYLIEIKGAGPFDNKKSQSETEAAARIQKTIQEILPTADINLRFLCPLHDDPGKVYNSLRAFAQLENCMGWKGFCSSFGLPDEPYEVVTKEDARQNALYVARAWLGALEPEDRALLLAKLM